ncbi:MAG: hypothetical protein WD063_12885 [Pirellulales bacterium]
MSRRAHAKPAGIQMFPFLAVLICTMGALVVLLHAFARHGQIEAIRMAEAKAQAQETSVEDFQWRIGHLRTARAKTEAELADQRLMLAHVEDHQRRLLEKLRQIERAAAEMNRAGAANTGQSHAAELDAVKAELAGARAALDAARRGDRHKRTSYSVIPYDGPHATSRRPIYIECRENLIVLQPESVELSPRDFAGSFAPGNPLAAAVRAQREYLARQSPGGLAEEPYPLLLVRPQGVAAYYAARAALDSWGSDFGYELIGSDWVLKFPQPDPQLASLTRKVVDEARLRHKVYASTSPQEAKRRSRPVYRARAHGGFAPEGGPGASQGLGRSGADGWNNFAGDWAQGADGRSDDDRFGSGSFSPGDSSMLQDPYGDKDDGVAGAGPNGLSASGSGSAAASGSRHGPSSDHGGLSAAGPSGRPGDKESGGEALAQAGGNSSAAGSPLGGHPANSSGADSESGAPAQGAEPYLTLPQEGGANTTQGGGAGSQASSHTPTASAHKTASMASARGHDWGLPESSLAAVPATRPILIDCYADRLVVVPESRTQAAHEIRLEGQARDSMDELVSAVWEHMKAWGKAGKGLYWRPTLYLDVKPGADGRFAEIQALLADSGLDVHRRQPRTVARPTTGPASRQPIRQ